LAANELSSPVRVRDVAHGRTSIALTGWPASACEGWRKVGAPVIGLDLAAAFESAMLLGLSPQDGTVDLN